VLNRITTLAMVRIGKTYGNLMVDIDATKNAKLVDRAARIIARLTGLGREAALALLEASGGKVKRAIVMHHRKCDVFTADRLLQEAKGKLRGGDRRIRRSGIKANHDGATACNAGKRRAHHVAQRQRKKEMHCRLEYVSRVLRRRRASRRQGNF